MADPEYCGTTFPFSIITGRTIAGILEEDLDGCINIVREADTISGCRELLYRHGLFVGGSTGTVYRAIQNYFCRSFTVRPRVLFSVLRSRHGVSA